MNLLRYFSRTKLDYESLVSFSTLLQSAIASAGSTTDNTLRSVQWVRQLWDFCEKEAQNPSKVAIHPIMEAFQNTMIARLLPFFDKSLMSPLDASAHPREPVTDEPCFQRQTQWKRFL